MGTGENITYQYDSLKWLVNASSTSTAAGNPPLCSDAYTYDGFGNLTNMAGSNAPTLSATVDQTTNRILPTDFAYDGNGNVTQFGASGTTLGYDVANRVGAVNSTNLYAYDSANKRVYYFNSSTEPVRLQCGRSDRSEILRTIGFMGVLSPRRAC